MSDDPGDLYIRYNASDDGNQHPLGGSVNFWASPSLWLSGAAASADDTITADAPGGGYINVRVDNKGATAHTDVQVQVWIGGPHLNLQPGNALPDGPSATSLRPPFSNAASPVALTVPANGFATIPPVPWHPTSADLQDLNWGPHLCIAANCVATNPQAGTISEGVVLTTASTSFDARQYQHMGQRNITLKPAPPGGMLRFPFQVINHSGETTEYRLIVDEILGDEGLDFLSREQILLARPATVDGLDFIELARLRAKAFCENLGEPFERILLSAGAVPVLVDSANTYEVRGSDDRAAQAVFASANFREHADFRRFGHGRCTEPTVVVRPGTTVPVTLDVTLNDDANPGAVHTFEVRQVDPEGNVVGGIRFLAIAATDGLLDPCGYSSR